jgi:hypothetical protein
MEPGRPQLNTMFLSLLISLHHGYPVQKGGGSAHRNCLVMPVLS